MHIVQGPFGKNSFLFCLNALPFINCKFLNFIVFLGSDVIELSNAKQVFSMVVWSMLRMNARLIPISTKVPRSWMVLLKIGKFVKNNKEIKWMLKSTRSTGATSGWALQTWTLWTKTNKSNSWPGPQNKKIKQDNSQQTWWNMQVC